MNDSRDASPSGSAHSSATPGQGYERSSATQDLPRVIRLLERVDELHRREVWLLRNAGGMALLGSLAGHAVWEIGKRVLETLR